MLAEKKLTASEVMMITIYFHYSGFKCFKAYPKSRIFEEITLTKA